MLKVEQPPTPGHERPHTLADLSRNASVISNGSSDSAPEPLLLTPPRRPRPIRTFSSPRSQSPSGPTTPRTSRPPAYMTRELGMLDEQPQQSQLPPIAQQHDIRTNHERRQRASSKSKSRPGSVARPSRDDFEFGDILGEGSYSTVIHVTHKESGREYACKVLDKQHLKRHNKLQTAIAEKNTLVRLTSGPPAPNSGSSQSGHPGIVRLHYAFQDEWSLFFVIDLASNGELQSRISRMGSLSTTCARYYAAQVVDALDYMHQRGVIHRDLKPENLLLDDAWRIKVTDFGTGKLIDIAAEHATKTFVGTAQYVSPELLEANETSKSSDLWALGCVLYQMIAGRFAFQGLSEYLTWQKIKQLEYSFPEGFDEQGKDLVRRLLVRDPLQRLGAGSPGSDLDMSALRAHPFFAPINWSTLWTDPAPPLETGLVRREVPTPGQGDWDDVGQAWDDLVGESSDDGSTPGQHHDGLAWAPDAEGAEYALFGKSRAAYEVGYVPPEDVGPRGELPDYARERLEKPTEAPPTPAVVTSPGAGGPSTPMDHGVTLVQGNGDIQFKLPSSRLSEQTPRSTSNTTVVPTTQPNENADNGNSAVDTESISTVSAGTGTDGSPDRESVVGAAPVGMPVPRSRRDTYATSSSDGSPVEKLGPFDTMKLRGRNRTRSPIGGSNSHSEPRPPLEPDWSSALSPGETILLTGEVEETVMKRRTSRLLLPIPVAPRRPKVRQLVLSSHRLLCLKQTKSGRGIGVKSEYGLRPSEKEKEKDRQKEERIMVTEVAQKGERGFVLFTTSRSAFFLAQDQTAAENWVLKISEALKVHGQQARERKPSNAGRQNART
ncbi:kinase-like protein [Peniophora sp. CONT]|nr:kinase-like protein [Peniophora sp. CONT]